MRWMFSTRNGQVQLLARAEGAGGLVGDAREVVTRGQDFYGVPYAALIKADAGIVEVDDKGVGKISKAPVTEKRKRWMRARAEAKTLLKRR